MNKNLSSSSNASLLLGKTALVTGSSRGIGAAIAKSLALGGCNVIVTGKSIVPHATLKGTIYEVTEDILSMGGKALAVRLDMRDDKSIRHCIDATVDRFGGIDILVNNASAINTESALTIPLKKLDLMFDVNVRGLLGCIQACVPYLQHSSNPHILTLSPPINLTKHWLKDTLPYTITKYAMSMCTVGLAEQLKENKIAVNSLWPQTLIATAAIEYFYPQHYAHSRHPQIVADAALVILNTPSTELTGQFLIDEKVLQEYDGRDLTQYATDLKYPLKTDFFIDE